MQSAAAAAAAAGHVWPQIAACEAALESGWGTSRLATRGNNLFGQKQGRKIPLPYPTIGLLTEEISPAGKPYVESDSWLVFPDWPTCFRERMALLGRLPIYAPALSARTGEAFVREVSGYYENQDPSKPYHARWSTDPQRADKVLEIFRANQAAFTGAP